MKSLIVVPILICAAQLSFGQEDYFDNLNDELVTIKQSPKIMGLLEAAAKINSYVDAEVGYRIQINSNKNKALIFKEKTALYKQYDDLDIYVVYEQPYYKLRVGDYKTRLEATAALMRIVEDFQYAFIVNDMIEIK
jgi:hypothetical protein